MAANDNIQIRISPDLKEKFYELCKENKDVPAAVIRNFIKEYVKKYDKGNIEE